MSLTQVYQSLTIRGCEIPNRVGRSAHATGLCFNGAITDRLIDYHLARAKGGVGLTILEGAGVHPSSASSLNSYDDSIIEGYRRLMAAITPHGMRVFQQLVHTGYMYPLFTQQPPWGVSPVPNPLTGVVPNPMGQAELDELKSAYAAAARRCREGGIDGIQIHAAHGYLFMQFLSPVINQRTDQYGGSLENRTRFLREVLAAVREAVGDDYPVGVRMGASIAPAGVGIDELAQVAAMLEKEGLIDYLDASWTDSYEFRFVGAMDLPMGYQLAESSRLTRAVKAIPRMVIGRFRTLDEVEQVLRDGDADMVHMTRAHIADPAIVAKTRAGNPDHVRPCIGCNQGCWFGSQGGLFPIACTVNAAAGMEGLFDEDMIVLTDNPGHVLVVGGGPAGMEAARVARLRGHRVTLVEAGPNLGGQVAVAKRAPRLHSIGDSIFWLEQEICRLGIDVRTNSYFETDDVLAEKPDYIVIATGAIARTDGMQFKSPEKPVEGYDLPHVISAEELLASPHRNLGRHAVVFDDVGHYEALAAAEHLISEGLEVTFATRFPIVGPHLDQLSRVDAALRRFAQTGKFTPLHRARLEKIEPGRCTITVLHDKEPKIVQADTVVLVTARLPMRDIFDELRERGYEARRNLVIVGDAHAPRDLQYAITDGHRLVRAMV